MIDLIRRIVLRVWKYEGLRYLIVGGANTALAYGLFALTFHLLTPYMHYMIALVFCTILNITVAFINYKLFVFRTKGNYFIEYVRFYGVYATPTAIGFVLFPFGVEVLHLNPYLTQALITAFTVAVSYVGHKHISFRKRA